jgi:hypothetical protein
MIGWLASRGQLKLHCVGLAASQIPSQLVPRLPDYDQTTHSVQLYSTFFLDLRISIEMEPRTFVFSSDDSFWKEFYSIDEHSGNVILVVLVEFLIESF